MISVFPQVLKGKSNEGKPREAGAWGILRRGEICFFLVGKIKQEIRLQAWGSDPALEIYIYYYLVIIWLDFSVIQYINRIN